MCDKNKEFWEDNHKNNNRYWLTDSDPDYIYRLHGLTHDIVSPGQSILEIGVGTGRSIGRLAQNNKVFAVDIAESALEKVKDYATTIQIHTGEWPENIIDIALCHLVFQHCDDNDFRWLIRNTIKSLTDEGYFTFQSADAEYGNLNENYRRYVAEGHMYFRSKKRVKEVVEEVGGKVISISDDIVYPTECNIVWNIYRAKRVS